MKEQMRFQVKKQAVFVARQKLVKFTSGF